MGDKQQRAEMRRNLVISWKQNLIFSLKIKFLAPVLLQLPKSLLRLPFILSSSGLLGWKVRLLAHQEKEGRRAGVEETAGDGGGRVPCACGASTGGGQPELGPSGSCGMMLPCSLELG